MPKFRHRLRVRSLGSPSGVPSHPSIGRMQKRLPTRTPSTSNRLRERAGRVDGVVELKSDVASVRGGCETPPRSSATRPWGTVWLTEKYYEKLAASSRRSRSSLGRLSSSCRRGRRCGPRSRASFSARSAASAAITIVRRLAAMLRRQAASAHRLSWRHIERTSPAAPDGPETWRRADPNGEEAVLLAHLSRRRAPSEVLGDDAIARRHSGSLTREPADARPSVNPSGILNVSGLSFAVAAFMKRAHIGTASSPANPFAMIVRGLSNPTQTPVTRCGVKPTNHAST